MTTDQPAHYQALVRPASGRLLAGVATGLANYLGVDPTLVRVAFVVLTLVGGVGVPLYLAGWLLMPEPGRGSIAGDLLHPQPADHDNGGVA